MSVMVRLQAQISSVTFSFLVALRFFFVKTTELAAKLSCNTLWLETRIKFNFSEKKKENILTKVESYIAGHEARALSVVSIQSTGTKRQ